MTRSKVPNYCASLQPMAPWKACAVGRTACSMVRSQHRTCHSPSRFIDGPPMAAACSPCGSLEPCSTRASGATRALPKIPHRQYIGSVKLRSVALRVRLGRASRAQCTSSPSAFLRGAASSATSRPRTRGLLLLVSADTVGHGHVSSPLSMMLVASATRTQVLPGVRRRSGWCLRRA